jgi:hypothetical protein
MILSHLVCLQGNESAIAKQNHFNTLDINSYVNEQGDRFETQNLILKL